MKFSFNRAASAGKNPVLRPKEFSPSPDFKKSLLWRGKSHSYSSQAELPGVAQVVLKFFFSSCQFLAYLIIVAEVSGLALHKFLLFGLFTW